MKHATPAALGSIVDLRAAIRKPAGLRERGVGVFSRGARTLFHSHADSTGICADMRPRDRRVRSAVSLRAEQRALIGRLRKIVR